MMGNYRVNPEKQLALSQALGCSFTEEGPFAEMVLRLDNYTVQTGEIPSVSFGFYHGPEAPLLEAVASVDEEWQAYFTDDAPVFCACCSRKPVAFCIVETEFDCMLDMPGCRIGGVGCVGTVPSFRRRGIGLRMVDLATCYLHEQGCDLSYIHFTGVEHWYAKLGYETFLRFSL